MRGKHIAKFIFMGILGAGAFFALGYVVMELWNHLMPNIFNGVHEISYGQAFGLFILAKLLFGGFRGKRWGRCGGCGCGWGHRGGWRSRWEDKWAQMTPEEREKFKKGWSGKWGCYYEEPKEEKPQ